MNLPNKITIFRLCMVPVLLAVALIDFPYHWCVTVTVYFFACMSDKLDGNIARKRHLVSDFGKLMDPLSDKALVMTAFAIMLSAGYCDAVCMSLMLAREFLVSGIRMIAATKGQVIAANKFGKAKTFLQMASTGLVFLSLAIGEGVAINYTILHIAAEIMFWVACCVSVLSGIKYTKDGWFLIETK
ncbi:MAG: CDP-diacylglycerol--glycerol-3-phosphate 3-phosphatidyltransferase [Clostridiales bacterium]|nr:CDP-diacylglycerol--glycerol-3-phosphate 3-phosphatidyltransferase [Clostridiales bacterium]